MASIIYAFEDMTTEKGAKLKYAIMSIPVIYSIYLFKQGNMPMLYFIGSLTIIMLLMFMLKVMNNYHNKKPNVLPDFNILEHLLLTIKSIFIMAPMTLVCIFSGIWLCKIPVPFPPLILYIVVWSIIGAIFITFMMSYSQKFSIKDAYNLKTIGNNCVDIFIAVLFFLPQLIILNAIILVTFVYLFIKFWNIENIVFITMCSIVFCINIGIIANYLAQVEVDTLVHE